MSSGAGKGGLSTQVGERGQEPVRTAAMMGVGGPGREAQGQSSGRAGRDGAVSSGQGSGSPPVAAEALASIDGIDGYKGIAQRQRLLGVGHLLGQACREGQ